MSTPRKVTRYCITMTEGHSFHSWILQASHDALSWITLHAGSQSFIGNTCFNVNNNNYYEYYRVKVFDWISTPGIVQVDFYEKVDDYTTTTSTYTTTTTTTETTTTLTTTHTTTITTLSTTTASTTAPILRPISYLTLSGNANSYELSWSSSPYAVYYELQSKYDDGIYEIVDFSYGLTFEGDNIPSTASTVQFRIRYHTTGTRASDWTESNVLTMSEVIANFKVSFNGEESDSFLRVESSGETLQFTDLSTSDHGDIVSWSWVFYTDNKGQSIYNITSTVKNPTKSYLSDGLFAVGLTVTDSTGRSNTIIKKRLLEVGCQLTVDFQAIDSNGVPCLDYIEVLYGSTVNFMGLYSGPGSVKSRIWEFGTAESYGGLSQTSTFPYPCKKYDTPGNYSVALTVTGEYGQTAFIQKPSFVRVSAIGVPTTTTWTSTTTTFTTTTVTTTTATTTSPANWLRITMQGGTPLCNSYRLGNEPYRAIDGDLNSQWLPDYSSTTTTTTTITTTSTSISTTTIDYFLSRVSPGLLWEPNTDLYNFRENFIELVAPNNVYKVRKVDSLPPFYDLYIGMVVYCINLDDFYVGVESGWSKINPDYVLHVLTHTTTDPVIVIGEQPPEVKFPGIMWVVPDTTTTTASTTTTTTATTLWIGNEALIGVGNYPQSSSFSLNHESTNAFDGNINTYWESGSLVSEESPEWLGFFWTTQKMIKWYKLYCGTQGVPYTWSIQASKNGLTWVEIDYRYEEVIDGWSWYALDNNTYYQFYRIYIHETSDGNKPRINTLEMYQSVVTTTTSTATTTATTTVP